MICHVVHIHVQVHVKAHIFEGHELRGIERSHGAEGSEPPVVFPLYGHAVLPQVTLIVGTE